MKKGLGVDAELIQGSGGTFDVTVDGRLIFSKEKLGRFPNPGEVLKMIRG